MNKYLINLYFFSFSKYLLIIFLAFALSFIIFYRMLNNKCSNLDIIYIFIVNIAGFAIGAKLFYLFNILKPLTISNFINSGYSFVGGLIGSIISIYMYCKKYKISFGMMQSYFMIIYPLIYSISKIGCLLNGCCIGIIPNIQLLESIIMFILFMLLLFFSKKDNNIIIVNFLLLFGVIRFVIDYYRIARHILIFNLTLNQLICIISIILGLILLVKYKIKR